MKKIIVLFLTVQFMFAISHKLFAQDNANMQEFGITAGAFTNFPANQDYLKKYMNVFYVGPYVRTGKHEFSVGIVYPLTTHGISFSDQKITPCVGATAGYKFYVWNVYSRENLFIHYSLQYLRFKGSYDVKYNNSDQQDRWTEKDMYINNVVGLGYNLFFDMEARFGFYYTLDYVIQQKGYQLRAPGFNDNSWSTSYIWNNISTNFGFLFKLGSLKKAVKP